MRRPSERRPATLRPGTGFAAAEPESAISATSGEAAFSSGAGLPTADEVTITLQVSADASAISAVGADLSSFLTGYAGNRALDFTNVTLNGTATTIEISNIAVSGTIKGNNDFTSGTPQGYDNDDNKLTYNGLSGDLPGLGSFSNLALSLTGDTVPVVCKLEWASALAPSKWALSSQMSIASDGHAMGARTFVATGLSATPADASDYDQDISGGIPFQTWSDNSTGLWSGTSVLSDRLVMDGSGDFPAFTFPLYVVGGALAKPTLSEIDTDGNTITQEFSITLGVASTSNDSGFSAWFGGQVQSFGGLVSSSGPTLIFTAVTDDGASGHADQIIYDGSRSSELIDGAGRPIPPYTVTLTGS